MRSLFALFTMVICFLISACEIAEGIEIDDTLAPGIVNEPEDVVIGEEDDAVDDGDVHADSSD